MKIKHTFGLGEPQAFGKQALFQPPPTSIDSDFKNTARAEETESTPARVRTTLELTSQALSIIQEIQCTHRLSTGKVLPLWKLVSQAIERYGRENTLAFTSHPQPALHDPDGKWEV